EMLEPVFFSASEPSKSLEPSAPSQGRTATGVTAYMMCPICMDAMEDDLVRVPCCKQIFHRSCIKQSVGDNKGPCPCCRTFFDISQIDRGEVRAPFIVVEGRNEPEVIDVRPNVKPGEFRLPPASADHPDSYAGGCEDTPMPQPSGKKKTTGSAKPASSEEGSATPAPKNIDLTDYNRLRRAASDGDTTTVLACHEAGMRLDVTDTDGNTLLHLAAENGHIDTALQLIKFGVSPNAQNKKQETALLVAAWKKQADMVAALYGNGANLHDKDEECRTAIYIAAAIGDLKTVNTLIT
ncbi:ankyrin repeat domain-containing protein, partial [Sansalvadorimonas verongulae]|uniref:ankyrin repeat domain-containing protein n=1 Tax=Sansalvadorimonas verongulae TaxID=2172824 RepID=UPI001E3B560E